MVQRIHSLISIALVVLLLAVATPLAWNYWKSQAQSQAYQARLADLAEAYDTLAQQYNQAITRTAVTELQVNDGQLDVVIRCATGERKRIATPFDPSGEIYVDYILRDGRLWIRRVFDGQTAPRDAVVIDPELADLDWAATGSNQNYGKAVYRSLTDGRWVITVTGDGSLGLRLADAAEEIELLPAPQLGEFPLARDSADEHTRPLSPGDYLEALRSSAAN